MDVNTEAENSVIAELTASFKVQEAAPAEDGSREHPFTTVDAYNTAIADDGRNGEDVYLTIDGQEFEAGEFALTNVQRRVNPPKLHLTLTDCTFNGNTSGDSTNTSFMYLSNCQELVIDGCTFDTESAGLVYGINWNLIQIEGATVNITDCTFSGKYEKNALKLNQRNGEDDAAVDVSMEGESPASIKSANIENCTFGGEGAIIQLGSAGKGVNGAAAPSTGGFPVTIKAADNSGVTVEQAYLMAKADEENPDSFRIALNPGQTGSKDESTGKGIFVTTKPVMIGDVGYDSLQEAVNAAAEEETGTTIVLNQNLTENVTIPVGANVIIDGQ